jgi:23S rRNA U2552 (ribose-2'-O)-methylase RlmE/FtsJ
MKQGSLKMMISIAKQIDHDTGAFTLIESNNKALDLCMAPGGIMSYILKRQPRVAADAITLPSSQGGHDVLFKPSRNDGQLNRPHADLTMFASELGVNAIPSNHPEAAELGAEWPFTTFAYDLILCDGQNLRTHRLLDYRRGKQQARLFNAPRIIDLRRVRPGGTFVVLLHRADMWRVFTLVK